MLDFIGLISDNVDWTAAQKIAMLDDFCYQYGYMDEIDPVGTPNPVTKKQFMNSKIIEFIKGTVNARRLKVAQDAIEIEELAGDLV